METLTLRTKRVFTVMRLNKYYSVDISSGYKYIHWKCSKHLKSRKVDSITLQRIEKRFYSLVFSGQYVPEKESLNNRVFEYIKLKNDLNISSHLFGVSNVFDNDHAIKQLHSVVFHSLQPSPNDVVKLLSLFTSCNRSTLHQVFCMGKSSEKFKIRLESSIPHMSFSQLHQFSISLGKLVPLRMRIFQCLARLTFEESLTRAESAGSLSDVIKYFIIGLELYGNAISTKIGYKEFVSVFEKNFDSASPLQLTQLLHFAGLSKKNALSDLPFIASKSLFSHFEDISFIDAGLATSGLFRLGLHFEKDFPLAAKIAVKIIRRADINCNDWTLSPLEAFSLVSMVKYLRISSYKNHELLHSLKLFLSKLDGNSFRPAFVCHVLALYATCNYYDHEVYSLLGEKFFHHLKSPEEEVRIKDVSRMMWALSHGQHQCEESSLNLVIKCLEEFSSTGELLDYPSHVVDATLALSTLGVYPEKLMTAVLCPSVVNSIRGDNRSRCLSRLMILSEVQRAAFPAYMLCVPSIPKEELPQRTISDEWFYRPCVKLIDNALQWLRHECGVPVFEIKFLVPHIHYCSVVLTGRTPKEANLTSDIGKHVMRNLMRLENYQIAIDVNDAKTTLEGEEKPVGMEELKRNILRLRGWRIKTVSSREVEGCGDDNEALAALLLQTALSDEK